LGAIAALILTLELLVRTGHVSPFLMPPPSAVAASFPMLFEHEQLLSRIVATFSETFAAASLATVIGVSAGWALNRWAIAHAAYFNWMVMIGAAPLTLLYPLFLVIFGRTALTIITMGSIAALPSIVLKTCEGLGSTRRVLLDVGRSFNLTPAQQFWKIQLPASAPTIFTGVRLGLIYGLLTIVGIEYLIAFGGLGQLVNDLADRYEVAAVYATVIIIMLINVCFFTSIEKVQKWLRPI
jgi:NitT/TauT family transport system permease protein